MVRGISSSNKQPTTIHLHDPDHTCDNASLDNALRVGAITA